MSKAEIYRAAPTTAALELVSALSDEHGGDAFEAARRLLLHKITSDDDGTMGIALEAYCLLQSGL